MPGMSNRTTSRRGVERVNERLQQLKAGPDAVAQQQRRPLGAPAPHRHPQGPAPDGHSPHLAIQRADHRLVLAVGVTIPWRGGLSRCRLVLPKRRSRSALPTTVTELVAIAAAASTGGRIPAAASGTSSRL